MEPWRWLLLSFAVAADGLEARWTPAADGGPARFSKRHRDAAGIDDSRWTQEDDVGGRFAKLLPGTAEGWAFAAMGLVAIVVLYRNEAAVRNFSSNRGGSAVGGSSGGVSAAEAAREAALKRHTS